MQDTAHNDFELDDFEEETFSTGSELGGNRFEDDEDEFVRASDFEEEEFGDDLEEDSFEEEGTHPDLRAEMQQAIDSGSSIASEYQSTFTEAERISTVLNLRSDSFTITHGTVSMLELSPTLPIKDSRKQTYKGLTQSVKELGILTPIHVMLTEGYKQYLKDVEEGYETEEWSKEEFGDKYILIDGFRRVWAGLTNKMEYAPAVIWDFNDMDLAMELLTPLSLLLNKTQRRDWSEVWGLYQILETTALMTPSTLEYLLQLEPGDAMKLKDVMLSGYDEVIEGLIHEGKSLQQSYNALQKLRKEENQLELDDQRSLSDIEGADGVVGDVTSGNGQLSYEEVKKLLEFDESDGRRVHRPSRWKGRRCSHR